MGRIFGTDGARGVVGKDIGAEVALKIGQSAAAVLTRHLTHTPKILIGKDTRQSCDMLESALAAGVSSVGADVMTIGVLPTPAVAYLIKYYQADAGIMISASHNPAEFNGIKLFSANGHKLPDSVEAEIEALILDTPKDIPEVTGDRVGDIDKQYGANSKYISHIDRAIDSELSGMRVAIDCANGSASTTAKKLFERLGAKCSILNASPDGVNINYQCGSTHMDELRELVVEKGFDLGFAFDGDADRCLAVDENGDIVDGDQMIAIFAKYLSEKNMLKDNTVVVTVMSNIGFFKFCGQHGITPKKTQVGDRYVLEEMVKNGYNLGGEQSGHIIMTDHCTTGDGQLSAAYLLSILQESGSTLSEMASVMKKYPQVLIGITASDEAKQSWVSDEVISETIKKHETALGNDGRILVRASGTEPIIRVMVEGPDKEIINRIANDIVMTIEERVCR